MQYRITIEKNIQQLRVEKLQLLTFVYKLIEHQLHPPSVIPIQPSVQHITSSANSSTEC